VNRNSHALFVNGIPAAGKSTVTTAVMRLDSRFTVVDGDKIVRRTPYRLRPQRGPQIWTEVLDEVDRQLKHGDTLLDFTMTAGQVLEARSHFLGRSTFVILRIDEPTRTARQRERDRRGNRLGFPWKQQYHQMPGSDDLYDLVLPGEGPRPVDSARAIIDLVDSQSSATTT